jgi:hypothetical protein
MFAGPVSSKSGNPVRDHGKANMRPKENKFFIWGGANGPFRFFFYKGLSKGMS